MNRLDNQTFQSMDVLALSKFLLGKKLCSQIDGHLCKGIIVETEAYRARDDKACHAFQNKRSKRNKSMFLNAGHAYIYLCYGIHHLFNVVSGKEGEANAVLIRALEPTDGIDFMKIRRKSSKLNQLTSGPGKLSQALGISVDLDGQSLETSKSVWIEFSDQLLSPEEIMETTRVGIPYAEECVSWKWRFYIKENPFISVE